MVYMGSKARIKKHILPYIQECIDANGIRLYVEPFVGGANVICDVKCKMRYGCDVNNELIALLRYMRDNPAMEAAPKQVTYEHYMDVKRNRAEKTFKYSLPYTAMVGYFASFGGKYFNGGYGRTKAGDTGATPRYLTCLANARRQAPLLRGCKFCVQGWEQTLASDKITGSFVYCDPLYKGTTPYDKQVPFDYYAYYATLVGIKDKAYVIASEFDMPCDNFVCIWEKETIVNFASQRECAEARKERLFTPKGGLYHKWWEEHKCLGMGSST